MTLLRTALRPIENVEIFNHHYIQCSKLCVDTAPSHGYVLQYLQPILDKFVSGDEKVCIIGFDAFDLLLGQSTSDPSMATIVYNYLSSQRRTMRLEVGERQGAKVKVASSRVCRNYSSKNVFAQCLKDITTARNEGKETMLTFLFESKTKSGSLCFMDSAQLSGLDREFDQLECLNGASIAVVEM